MPAVKPAFKFDDTAGLLETSSKEPLQPRPFQLKTDTAPQADNKPQLKPFQLKAVPNKTGLPDNLKNGIENLSGYSLDDVKVHYNSDKPAQLSAHAYAQGTDIHVASGQEKHLPHEAWHVVQQKQGRVQPTLQMKGEVPVNDDQGLEHEADVMGQMALSAGNNPAVITNHAPAKPNVKQLKLEIDGKDVSLLRLNHVLRLILAKHSKKEFIKQSNSDKKTAARNYDAAKATYKLIREVHPSVYTIVKQLQKYQMDKTVDHSFDTWPEAAATAHRDAYAEKKARSKIHPPSPPSSPYTTGQQQYIDHLNGPGRKAEHMPDNKVWNELKVHGQIGEFMHQQQLTTDKVDFRDANDLFGYNAPGIDTLINSDMPFGQSKMHLGSTESAAAMVKTYTDHIKAAPAYARTFLKRLFSEVKSGQVMRQKLAEINAVWKNTELTKLEGFAKDPHWREEDALEPNADADDNVVEVAPVELVVQGMVFPVPSDVYDEIPTRLQSWFERMPYDLNWYRKIKSGIKYNFGKVEKTEKDLDPDFSE